MKNRTSGDSPILKLVLTVALIVALPACSLFEYQKKNSQVKASLMPTKSHDSSNSNPLNCAYTQQKGIAEITHAEGSQVFLIFIPGEVVFSIDSNYLLLRNISIEKGLEFRAVYSRPQSNNSAACPKPIPKLTIR